MCHRYIEFFPNSLPRGINAFRNKVIFNKEIYWNILEESSITEHIIVFRFISNQEFNKTLLVAA